MTPNGPGTPLVVGVAFVMAVMAGMLFCLTSGSTFLFDAALAFGATVMVLPFVGLKMLK